MSVQPPRDRYPDSADSGAETVGPFQLVSQVAIGELASLYAVRPVSGPAPEQPLLVKRLVGKHARDPEYQAALRREAELCASLLSPDIVRTLNLETTPELYTVMERIEGANLAVLLMQARQHDLDTTRFAVPLIVGALRALEYLHGGQDPKSGAFLVHQAPVARHIMGDFAGRSHIIDLTLAMGPALPRSPLTDQRLRPYEMAPEQALAPHTVDPRCDVFIVGMTLWETLTGQRLFAGRSPIEAQKKMLSGTIVPPSETGTGAHHCFDRLCMRALARTRGTRFPSAAEMASELQDAAVRAGLYAEPEELGAWVRNTLALGRRPAPSSLSQTLSYAAPLATPPRDESASAKSVGRPTMMGIGVPNADVLKIAEAYRESESLKQTRSGRRGRSAQARSSAPTASPMLRVGADTPRSMMLRARAEEPRASPSAGRNQARDSGRTARSSVSEDAREAGFSVVGGSARPSRSGRADFSRPDGTVAPQLGGLGSSDEWLPATPRRARVSFATLSIAGVITAGLLALMMRVVPDHKPVSFEPAPLPTAALGGPASSGVSAERAPSPSDSPPVDLTAPSPAPDQASDQLPQPAQPALPADAPAPPGVLEAQAPAPETPTPMAIEAIDSTPLKPAAEGSRHGARAGLRSRAEEPRVSIGGGRSGASRHGHAAAPAPVAATTPATLPGSVPANIAEPAAPVAASASTAAAPRWQAPSTLRSRAEEPRASTLGGSKQAKWASPGPAVKPAVTPDAPRWGNPPAATAGSTGLPDNPF